MQFQRAIAAAVVFTLAACSGAPSVIPLHLPAPETDFSTPDLALRSYWKNIDAANDVLWMRAHLARVENQEIYDRLNLGLARDMHRGPGERPEPTSYSREITSVTMEKDSRAVIEVRIRNTTPIPAAAQAPGVLEEMRAEGELYRYLMERKRGEWHIAQRAKFDAYRDSFENEGSINSAVEYPYHAYFGR